MGRGEGDRENGREEAGKEGGRGGKIVERKIRIYILTFMYVACVVCSLSLTGHLQPESENH